MARTGSRHGRRLPGLQVSLVSGRCRGSRRGEHRARGAGGLLGALTGMRPPAAAPSRGGSVSSAPVLSPGCPRPRRVSSLRPILAAWPLEGWSWRFGGPPEARPGSVQPGWVHTHTSRCSGLQSAVRGPSDAHMVSHHTQTPPKPVSHEEFRAPGLGRAQEGPPDSVTAALQPQPCSGTRRRQT